MLQSIRDDMTTAVRALVRAPGFFATSVVVLGLGLGATLFMFAVMNTFFLKPPPFDHAERLYRVFGTLESGGRTVDELALADFLALRGRQASLDGMTALTWQTAVVTGDGIPERFDGAAAAPNLFDLLGVQAIVGRTFTTADGAVGAAPVALLSYDVWRNRYGGNASVIGRAIIVNGQSRTIVGVLPKGFGIIGGEGIWTPILVDGGTLRDSAPTTTVWVFARARDGVSQRQIEADLNAVMLGLAREHPSTNTGLGARVMPLAAGIIGPDSVSGLRRQFGAAVLALLIACLTVATLMFVRANHRQFETGMRATLGATPRRIVQLVMCEAVVIASVAMLVGLLVAHWGLRHYGALIDAIGVYGGVPSWWRFELDGRVTAFAVAAALGCAALAGIVPSLRVARATLVTVLQESSRTATNRRLRRFMGIMVSVEIGCAVALLCAAALLARGAYLSVDKPLGVDATGIMTGSMTVPADAYSGEEYGRFVAALTDSLRDQPGVLGAALATALPGLGAPSQEIVRPGLDSARAGELPSVDDVSISRGFLAGLGIAVRRGREFDARDRYDTLPVAIVNQAFVDAHLDDEDPIGRRIAFRGSDNKPLEWLEIVGVAPNINHNVTWGPGGSWRPTVYTPLAQREPAFISIAVRGGGSPVEQARLIREALRTLDPDVPAYYVRTLATAQSERRAGYQLGAVNLLGFSVVGFVLAIVGLYAVLAFTVGQRVRDIGIRRALGARDSQIIRNVLGDTAWQLLAGLGIGAALAPFAARQAVQLMEGLSLGSPLVYLFSFGLVATAALIACVPPTARALRIEAADVLRSE